MNQENQSQKSQRRPVSEKYIDLGGNEQTRASSVEFKTLPYRHIEVVYNLPGFQEDKELIGWMGSARGHYDAGYYDVLLENLTRSLKRMLALEPYVFYYMRVCERVIAIPLTEEEVQYEAKLARYRTLPKWRRWMSPKFDFHVRCKWCGRYIRYIHPDVPTYGFASLANSCRYCERMYPMPSWMWDSPDGRAYSYYRMSFSDEEFYEEFEQDYAPKPLCKRRRK